MLFPSLANNNQHSGNDGRETDCAPAWTGNEGSTIMTITPYLRGPYYFDLETRRALGLALELACISLCTDHSDEHVKQAIADKLIALAKTGERNPNVLCVKALEAICSEPEHDFSLLGTTSQK